ncbi:tetrahydromethanopterin S-methyltransferase subunit H [Desulfofundulus sp. TPOSR]|jgi:tetrahydromethanopterin S-methyltransferase subunit H|uniref:tetrahydromethanopterin S-methyltransferase subunit H family protein n=1 Tax=Desulfofundulus sp. TPOSR TaxID=2714340 RepID=UPI00140DADAA|nr:tetrahydromethanopterin S-methyltransferase subunit H [Desulfofundulus sp. TPOSR]NHM26659.1 tetrahydromethanopterin S-methyltransferase subunit H [Desulfofundulus sp. TPOSR]
MFKLSRPQRVCRIGRWNIGGQPGENPPLLISSMFHNGDKILESRKERKFNREKATEYVKRQEELSAQTGVPALVAMVATSLDEMKTYIDFFLSISDQPFGIDMWVEKTRLEVAEYIARLGIQDRVLYNSITPWDKDIPGQVARLKELGIKHVVVQAFNQEDQTPKGRVTGLKKMLDIIGEDTFETILVDTAVMNLPSTSFSCIACRLVKEEFGWPAGVASSNGTYMWKAAREMWGSEGFNAMNAAGQAIAALLWSDLLFSGPIVNIPKIIPAVTTASLMLSTLVYDETGKLPPNQDHPLYKFFADFVKQLQ